MTPQGRHRSRAVVAVVCTASFIAVADTTIVSVALPAMRTDLGFSGANLSWVLNAYALTFGGLLLVAGRVGELIGLRRIFSIGLAVFAAGAFVGGVAPEPATLVAGRFLQGVGAAGFVPASLSLLTATFSDERVRQRAIGTYGAMAALGFVAGMVGGGVITELWGWRWVLLVNVPVALATVIGGYLAVSETRAGSVQGGLDLLGAVTGTSGLVAVLYGLSRATDSGWTSVPAVVAFTLGVTLLLSFVRVERAASAPLLPPSLLRRAGVLRPNIAIALQSMVGVSWLYLLTLYLQDVLGQGPLPTGLLFAPMTVAGMCAASSAGRLVNRWGTRWVASIGLGVVTAGIFGMLGALTAEPQLPLLVASMVVGEVGFMFSNVALTVAGTSHDGLQERAGLAAGLLNTSIQIGSGAGLGIVAAVVSSTGAAASAGDEPTLASLRAGMLACLVFGAVAFALVVLGLDRTTRPSRSRVGTAG